MSSQDKKDVVVVGIDIGSESTKVVLGPSLGCEIVRNEVGGHTTPTIISFSGNLRQIGQTANKKSKHAITHVNRILSGEISTTTTTTTSGGDGDKFQEFYSFNMSKVDNNGGGDSSIVVNDLDYNGKNHSFEAPAILAMLLGNIQSNAQATVRRIHGSGNGDGDNSDDNAANGKKYHYVLSVGPELSERAKTELLDAAYVAGMESVRLVESSQSYTYCYQRKFPDHLANGKKILIVDMGETQTTVSVVGGEPVPSSTEEKEGEEEKEQKEEEEPVTSKPQKPKVFSSFRNKSLGAGLVDIRLWEHFQSNFPALKSVKKNSRAGQRLLDGSSKLKHLLSQLADASVTVENVGENDTDLKLNGTRQLLSELCQADKTALTDLIQKALSNAGEGTLFAVEVVGGGCRIPWVKDAILSALGEDKQLDSLSYSFDDTSAALGAALIGEDESFDASLQVKDGNEEKRQKLRQAEEEMKALDQDMQIRADTMNKIEAHILEMRSAKHGKHGSLLPSTLDAFLDDVENWLFSEEADQASKEDVLAKLDTTIKETNEMAKDYSDALQKEKDAKDREMEEEAKKAQEERDGEQDGEEDDHDNRRLPKKRRMEIVMKNKAEANELFSDGNYKFAAARYTKALSHCAKFVDLSPDDIEEVNSVKLSLNLNLALAYLKLENPDQALRVCNEALAIQDNHAKALYRRASVYYEKKNWDLANKDVKKALKEAPDDKALKKLGDRIDAQMKRQKLKEKKMAQKMFG